MKPEELFDLSTFWVDYVKVILFHHFFSNSQIFYFKTKIFDKNDSMIIEKKQYI